MRLPFVSRAHYELLQHNYGEMRGLYDHLVKTFEDCIKLSEIKYHERERYEALLDKYHALKLQGATITEPHAPIERKEQDEVTRRINILSVGRPGLRAQMLKQVANDRLFGGLDDVAIMQRIEAGVTSDDGVIA